MARRLAAALAFALAALALPHAAKAQALQRLTVDSFVLSSDTAKPQIEVPFQLIITLHVRQQVGEIDNLVLPILAELELRGDERRLESGNGGTQYRETITVVAHHTGTITIAPATLQAIDARDGKPKQYFTNSLTLQVSGGALEPLNQGGDALGAMFDAARTALIWLLGIACVLVLAFLIFRRRRPAVAVPAPVAAAPPPPPAPPVARARSRRDQVSDALAVLRAEPFRPTAIRVRTAVWQMVGAPEGETLADVLARVPQSDVRMREVLSALERAAFTYDADLHAAIAAACNAMERFLA